MNNPLVSLIISTKNEEGYIRNLLRSLKNQTYKNIEVIVVDNNSSDKTISIAKEFTRFVYTQGPERSAQRNYGASKAKGEYLLFLDADMELSPDVVEKCVTMMQQKHNAGIIIPEESIGIGFWAACKKLERSFYLGIPWIEAARFYRNTVFKKAGGFNLQTTGTEDFDLYQAVKTLFGNQSIGRINSFIYHNEGKLSLLETMKKKYYYSKTIPAYIKKESNKEYFSQQGSIISRYKLFFSSPSKLLANPIVGVGMLFMKTSEFAAGGIGFLEAKITQQR